MFSFDFLSYNRWYLNFCATSMNVYTCFVANAINNICVHVLYTIILKNTKTLLSFPFLRCYKSINDIIIWQFLVQCLDVATLAKALQVDLMTLLFANKSELRLHATEQTFSRCTWRWNNYTNLTESENVYRENVVKVIRRQKLKNCGCSSISRNIKRSAYCQYG